MHEHFWQGGEEDIPILETEVNERLANIVDTVNGPKFELFYQKELKSISHRLQIAEILVPLSDIRHIFSNNYPHNSQIRLSKLVVNIFQDFENEEDYTWKCNVHFLLGNKAYEYFINPEDTDTASPDEPTKQDSSDINLVWLTKLLTNGIGGHFYEDAVAIEQASAGLLCENIAQLMLKHGGIDGKYEALTRSWTTEIDYGHAAHLLTRISKTPVAENRFISLHTAYLTSPNNWLDYELSYQNCQDTINHTESTMAIVAEQDLLGDVGDLGVSLGHGLHESSIIDYSQDPNKWQQAMTAIESTVQKLIDEQDD